MSRHRQHPFNPKRRTYARAFTAGAALGWFSGASVAVATETARPSTSNHLQSHYVPLMWRNGRIPLAHGNTPLARKPYLIARENGELIRGVTDAQGWTQPVRVQGLEWVTLHVLG